jgi:hypothetical protein
MNIWDSVHRGLEKASQEAARIAKIQKLRSTIDGVSRQINTQHGTLITTTMDLFAAGKLTQPELLSLCQELTRLHQQLTQAQNELRLAQSQVQGAAPSGTPDQLPPGAPYARGGEYPPTVYAPPYIDSTLPIPAPPPPPDTEPATVSSLETVSVVSAPTGDALLCSICHAELVTGNAYCHNCGSPVGAPMWYPPTTRGDASENSEGATLLDPATPPQTPEPKQPDGGQ